MVGDDEGGHYDQSASWKCGKHHCVGGNCDVMETLNVSFVFSMDEGTFASARLATRNLESLNYEYKGLVLVQYKHKAYYGTAVF